MRSNQKQLWRVFMLMMSLGAARVQADPCKGLKAAGQDFVMSFAKKAVAGPFTVVSSRVLEDSRCPDKVMCFWAGRAVIALDIQQANESSNVRLGYELQGPMRVVSREDEPTQLEPGQTQLGVFTLGIVHMPLRQIEEVAVSSFTLHVAPLDPAACTPPKK